MGKKTFLADKETLDKVYELLVDDPVFGFIEHMNILSPSQRIEYIGLNADYTPMTRNGTGIDLGSWAEFKVVEANKPYMVRSNGVADYQLMEDDYTKKASDGSISDVANTSYDGGAFSWLQKIYKSETMVGNDRIVKFSLTKRSGYAAVGFIDPNGNELEGVWLPMFYGSIVSGKMRSLSGLQPDHSGTTDQQNTAISAVSGQAKFLGGSIIGTINDLLLMFCKNGNLQAVFGTGNCDGYDESLEPTMGVKKNAVIAGGQFYATDDGKHLNKIFHSIVLGSYQQWMRDPYTLLVDGQYKVSPNYKYDLTGASYRATGITLPDADKAAWKYPSHYGIVPGFGAVPIAPFDGSTSMGGCDGVYFDPTGVRVARLFGDCISGLLTGPRCLALDNTASDAHWYLGSALLLLPPVGVAV